jgi:hypothetical protein
MRTTIHLDDNLLLELRQIAAATGRTLTSVIQDALRESLSRRRTSNRSPIELPVFHGTGLLPGVDLHDSASMLERMESGGDPP